VVKTLRARMEHDFDKYGIEREHEPESEHEDSHGNGASVSNPDYLILRWTLLIQNYE
jgi:hypothetical protein